MIEMFPPGPCLSSASFRGTSPSITVEFLHSGFMRVLDATSFGVSFMKLAIPSSLAAVGQ
jgi:hypothetical protein